MGIIKRDTRSLDYSSQNPFISTQILVHLLLVNCIFHFAGKVTEP